MAETKAWELVSSILGRTGFRHVWGLPDDDMVSLREIQHAGIEFRWMPTQRGAIAAASGAALSTCSTEVVILGRGPGTAAAVPALLEATDSHSSLIVLCTGISGSRSASRAFQDAPIQEMVSPVSLASHRAHSYASLDRLLRSALLRHAAGDNGPIVIEIPEDLGSGIPLSNPQPTKIDVNDAIARVIAARRPVLMVGGGARGTVERGDLVELAEALDCPTLVTASARGIFPETHRLFLGLAGLYMSPAVRDLVNSADVLVSLASALEETTMTGMPNAGTTWIQINHSASAIAVELGGYFVPSNMSRVWHNDCRAIWALAGSNGAASDRHQWASSAEASMAADRASFRENYDTGVPAALRSLERVLDASSEKVTVVHENGLHDIWSHLVPCFRLPYRASAAALSEQTSLGHGVLSALGTATLGPTVCICGDGAMMTALPDILQMRSSSVPLLYLVFDDGGYGWLDLQARLSDVGTRFNGDCKLSNVLKDTGLNVYSTSGTDFGETLKQAWANTLAGRLTIVHHIVRRVEEPPLIGDDHS